MWYRQLADMISAAVQSGKCPDGDKRLQALLEKLQKSEGDKSLAAYVKFRQLTAAYGLSHAGPQGRFRQDPDRVAEEPRAVHRRLSNRARHRRGHAPVGHRPGVRRPGRRGEEVVQPNRRRSLPTRRRPRRRPARRRGWTRSARPIALSGKSPTGGTVDLANYRGKVVLIQYWATWCGPCKNDMAVLKQLSGKFAPSFAVISVSLDTNAKDLNAFLAENKLSWPQIFEEGGLDSRPANALGILTVPTMILVDQQGKVVNRNVQMAELEGELKKLIK